MTHSRSIKKFKHIRNSFLIHQLAHSFIKNGFIKTTLTRAKALTMFLEPIICIARKEDALHNQPRPDMDNKYKCVSLRRLLVKKLKSKSMAKLMTEKIAPHFRTKNQGGYLRIIKIGVRSDSATMAYLCKSS